MWQRCPFATPLQVSPSRSSPPGKPKALKINVFFHFPQRRMSLEAARAMWLRGGWTSLWPWSKRVGKSLSQSGQSPRPPTRGSPRRFTDRSCRDGKPGEHAIGKLPNWINPRAEEERSAYGVERPGRCILGRVL